MLKKFWAIFLLVLINTNLWAADLLDFVPINTSVCFVLNNIQQDEGLKYLYTKIKNRYTQEAAGGTEGVIKFLTDKLNVTNASGGSKWENNFKKDFLMLEFCVGDDPQNKIPEAIIETARTLLTMANPPTGGWQEIKINLGQQDYKINYDSRFENNQDLTCFTNIGNIVILASNSNLAQEILFTATKQKPSIKTMGSYSQIQKHASLKNEASIFINDFKQTFLPELRKWEKENNILLLMSADFLESVLMRLDIIDPNNTKAQIIFKSAQTGKIPLVQNDAQFLGEILKRKYASTNATQKSTIKTEQDYVILNIELKNTKDVWEKEIFK